MLTCQRTLRAYVLTANVPCVLSCSYAKVPSVLTCSRVNFACVLMCSHVNVPCVLTCSCTSVPCIPTCSRAITWNYKSKFSMTRCKFSLSFLRSKTVYEKCTTSSNISRNIYFKNSVVDFCIFLTGRKLLTGAMTNFVQQNDSIFFVWVEFWELFLSG